MRDFTVQAHIHYINERGHCKDCNVLIQLNFKIFHFKLCFEFCWFRNRCTVHNRYILAFGTLKRYGTDMAHFFPSLVYHAIVGAGCMRPVYKHRV